MFLAVTCDGATDTATVEREDMYVWGSALMGTYLQNILVWRHQQLQMLVGYMTTLT